MLKNSFFLASLILVFFITSCDDKRVFDEYKTVSGKWKHHDVVSFTFKAPDTLKTYNLYINLRNNNDYKFSNLYLIVEMNYPHGKTIKDTLNYKMAKPDGSFLGTGFTDVKENKLWYKGHNKSFVFEENGAYIVNIQQAMRKNGEVEGIDELEGITEVGFRVEPAIMD